MLDITSTSCLPMMALFGSAVVTGIGVQYQVHAETFVCMVVTNNRVMTILGNGRGGYKARLQTCKHLDGQSGNCLEAPASYLATHVRRGGLNDLRVVFC